MSLDISSLECLVAIAIVSYVLGYLPAQMQFPDRPSGEPYFWHGSRLRAKARGRGAGLGAEVLVTDLAAGP